MTDVNDVKYPTEELVGIFSHIVDESKGDVSKMFQKLNVPPEYQGQLDRLKEGLSSIASGSVQDIRKFVGDLEAASLDSKARLLRGAEKGGCTKLVAHWWGCELYISHSVLEECADPGVLIGALVAICHGSKGIITLICTAVALEVLRFIDQGNGVIVRKYGWIGPPIPFRQ